MPGDRVRRRVEALLDEAEAAIAAGAWVVAAEKARAVLAVQPDSEEARAFLRMAASVGPRDRAVPMGAALRPRLATRDGTQPVSAQAAPEAQVSLLPEGRTGERWAAGPPAALDPRRRAVAVTLMFSDIEGSTGLMGELGDAGWLHVLTAHNRVLEESIRRHGGRTVKTMGDGYMAAFSSAEAGVRSALAVQAAFAAPTDALQRVRVRIGVHTGQVVRQGADFFGREVNYAARVAAAAIGGEVVVSAAVRARLTGLGDLEFSPARMSELKGFEGSHEVFTVVACSPGK